MTPDYERSEAYAWRSLYRRAINEANGLTNYVEDRPGLRSAERRISKIEDEARAIEAAHGIKDIPAAGISRESDAGDASSYARDA